MDHTERENIFHSTSPDRETGLRIFYTGQGASCFQSHSSGFLDRTQSVVAPAHQRLADQGLVLVATIPVCVVHISTKLFTTQTWLTMDGSRCGKATRRYLAAGPIQLAGHRARSAQGMTVGS